MLKKKVAIIFGGQTSEHEVSLASAMSVIKNIDKDSYDLVTIGIAKDGRWLKFNGDLNILKDDEWVKSCERKKCNKGVNTYPGVHLFNERVDVVFPIIHGKNGEDGTLQGLLELCDLPYVGSGVLSSAIALDKGISNAIFDCEKIPQAGYVVFTEEDINEKENDVINTIESKFEYPIFIKPANTGSSIGVSKSYDREALKRDLVLATKYDSRVIVEEFIKGLEIECSVIGNENPIASLTARIIPCKDFYDYEAKYKGEGSEIKIPSGINSEQEEEVKEYAIKAYKALNCAGMARVDFFIREKDNKVLINEINTIPGFTQISMYPRLWEAEGISYKQLLSNLVEYALKLYNKKKAKD